MGIATFLSYFSLALFLFVMYLRYQYVKNKLLAARRKREIAFLQQMSHQFKRQTSPKSQPVTVVQTTTGDSTGEDNPQSSVHSNLNS
jgi:hypothetical protein